MDELLATASRLALAIAGVGGSIAVLAVVRRRNLGWIPAAATVMILLSLGFSATDPAAAPSPLLVMIASAPYFVGFPLLAATFPDGRVVPRWALVVPASVLVVLIGNAVVGDAWRASDAWWIVPAVSGLFAIVVMAYRYRVSATTAEREAVRWVLLGVLVAVAGFMLIAVIDGSIGEGGPLATAKANAAGLPMLIGLIIGAVWPRVWNVDIAFRAVLVALGAGWALGGVFAAASALSRGAGVDATGAAGWGAVAVGVAAYPVIRLVARAAAWLVFRDRLDADAATARLASVLESDDARPIAGRIVDVAAGATGSPAVRLTAVNPADAEVFDARAGLASGAVGEGEGFAVTFHGERLATLTAAPRPGESELSARDRSALSAIAQHAAPALDGARALRHATAAQSQLVMAREEERRRLRRELHDDLGPALSGLALSAAAIARRADALDVDLAATARELQKDIAGAEQRSREISHGLRPAALDDRGLDAAIRERLGPVDDVRVAVGDIGELPAAASLAALRIVQEAVTNARRHAEASDCRVRVEREGAGLRVEIDDNGVGMPHGAVAGLGLRSIRERAAELGGRTRISTPAGGGTRVSVWLPLRAEATT